MDILWHGQSCFEIRTSLVGNGENRIVVIDPFSQELGLELPSIKADVLLITHQHPDHNNIKAIKGAPFLIEGPGEYEVKGVLAQGILAWHGFLGKENLGDVTIYLIEADGIRLCHLGDINQKELSSEQIEALGGVDILMVPVGGKYTIDAEGAQRIINQIEPKIIIPMHYKLPGLKTDLQPVDVFLKVMGQEGIVPQPSLKVKKQNLPGETKLVVLTP